MSQFNGFGQGLGMLDRLSAARTRLITAENVYGEKGRGGMAEVSDTPQPDVVKIGLKWNGANECARELGTKWKVRPCITLPAGETTTIMDIDGPGYIQHMWLTFDSSRYRDQILRIFWDGEDSPSVETPLGDFFCNGFNTRANILALPINVNPSGGFNSYFPMPFRKHARVTVENRNVNDVAGFYYAITFSETEVPDDAAYFHAHFRRTNPLRYGDDYVILDGVAGHGHYVGTYMAWQQNNKHWWGEGEIKFFLDGDGEYPSLCGTGTEDYFGGAWCFGQTYSAPFLGYPLGDVENRVGGRHGLYRFHVLDPIRFTQDLKVTMQAIGWRSENRYLPLQDDISSVAYWYQTEPHIEFPKLGDRNALEVI